MYLIQTIDNRSFNMQKANILDWNFHNKEVFKFYFYSINFIIK